MIVSAETAAALSGGIMTEADIGLYLPAAQEMCESYCNRQFESAERTQLFDGGRHSYLLPAYPITAVSEVKINGTVTTDYEYDADMGEVWLTSRPPSGHRTVSIKYTGGYEADEVPYALQLAVSSLAAAMPTLMEGGGQLSAGNGERIGSYQAGYTRTSATEQRDGLKYVSPVTAALLSQYKGRWV